MRATEVGRVKSWSEVVEFILFHSFELHSPQALFRREGSLTCRHSDTLREMVLANHQLHCLSLPPRGWVYLRVSAHADNLAMRKVVDFISYRKSRHMPTPKIPEKEARENLWNLILKKSEERGASHPRELDDSITTKLVSGGVCGYSMGRGLEYTIHSLLEHRTFAHTKMFWCVCYNAQLAPSASY